MAVQKTCELLIWQLRTLESLQPSKKMGIASTMLDLTHLVGGAQTACFGSFKCFNLLTSYFSCVKFDVSGEMSLTSWLELFEASIYPTWYAMSNSASLPILTLAFSNTWCQILKISLLVGGPLVGDSFCLNVLWLEIQVNNKTQNLIHGWRVRVYGYQKIRSQIINTNFYKNWHMRIQRQAWMWSAFQKGEKKFIWTFWTVIFCIKTLSDLAVKYKANVS